MPTVFVYEWCVAVGPGRDESDPARPLYRLGRAMRDAVVADFAALPGTTVTTLDDAGPAEEAGFRERASAADWTLAVAPETGGLLAERCRWLAECGGRSLGCPAAAVAVASDKLALSERLRAAGVNAPRSWRLADRPADLFPCVVKPNDGAGSVATVRADEPADLAGLAGDTLIAQEYIPGRPASVAFLVGPRETVPLVPTFQHLSGDGRFRYLGGELPIPPDLSARAVALGRRAVGCVPGLKGYVGVDLVLGDAADGSSDFAIEINPRLSTSYVGLRTLADTNLAGALLRTVRGEPVGELRWKPGRVRFVPGGAMAFF